MRYTLRQLQVFLAAARHENVSRAAETLAMSQSAASGALKELEQQFDVLLFDRIGKRLQLSELGRQLRPQAEALLEQATDFEHALALLHSPLGRLTLWMAGVALIYHFCNGIRFLTVDAGWCESRAMLRLSAQIVLAIAALFALIFAALLW